MASVNGDWFHSRVSSHLSELITVRKLVLESRKSKYIGFRWSGGRENNSKMYEFANSADITPSQMQTKIRAMIRYGFLKDGTACPLHWTTMGDLWNELYSVGNESAAKQIYQLVLLHSLAIYTFRKTNPQYSCNPTTGELPLKTLFNVLDKNNTISLTAFKKMVDGKKTGSARNFSYWATDLINTGLFNSYQKTHLFYNRRYLALFEAIKNFQPNPNLSDADWKDIRENPLLSNAPFQELMKEAFLDISEQKDEVGDLLEEYLVEPIITTIAAEEENLIPEMDVLSTGTKFVQTKRRVRNATWSLRIKKQYAYKCAVPKCDVEGKIFIEAAHIKPDKIKEGEIPHRAHILNGLCLCRHCHVAFDKGYFSLTNNHKIIVAEEFKQNVVLQHLKKVILASENRTIKNRKDNRLPLIPFVEYHRHHKFKH